MTMMTVMTVMMMMIIMMLMMVIMVTMLMIIMTMMMTTKDEVWWQRLEDNIEDENVVCFVHPHGRKPCRFRGPHFGFSLPVTSAQGAHGAYVLLEVNEQC